MMKDKPTTLYIYPESTDIDGDRASGEGRPVAVARRPLLERLVPESRSASPKFWPKETLEPILVKYKEAHPQPPRAAAADLQGAVKSASRITRRGWPPAPAPNTRGLLIAAK